MSKWISVKESKPEQGDRVLLAINAYGFTECVVGYWGVGQWEACCVHYKVDCTNYCAGGMVDTGFDQEDVTHYQPLPEPPEGV